MRSHPEQNERNRRKVENHYLILNKSLFDFNVYRIKGETDTLMRGLRKKDVLLFELDMFINPSTDRVLYEVKSSPNQENRFRKCRNGEVWEEKGCHGLDHIFGTHLKKKYGFL